MALLVVLWRIRNRGWHGLCIPTHGPIFKTGTQKEWHKTSDKRSSGRLLKGYTKQWNFSATHSGRLLPVQTGLRVALLSIKRLFRGYTNTRAYLQDEDTEGMAPVSDIKCSGSCLKG